ncbi:N-acetyl-gamma-glutamyl-phosphate reductase [Corynebacterium uberis]|uniref:N-acetyl-gamma-glutamyl-phosphate reductase n=1 Tax=Corynebacterium TaxID=1716 RepID=UPI001D0B652D|nr:MULTISPECIES: N-acetyl-gamma-glutamyl-phosphate reductase [Corynebacterium]MCZ9309168.1 N-acetyl-gamma-glutamyl-phosphate reductase [Corynebacterium sp. c6VSa_13]UDL76793.1 N-acetyl-gamma-glutamyl-phosphate reductase [Corynebacterium uberis]UDL79006.1 N-acetyl-gamma-glutamyl-phosphate reductase [Corynebacterium uberis]UDL81283.1 N-acetyl-gamma-glutamyl-phosphate reductase [Corynebacterium uberis]UDL85629.1 N-acetyl-gamma-glutamyl-phosphate reductase [Corynebacterium uberis]
MTFQAAIAGASGYAGGEILRLLLGHPAMLDGTMSLGALTAHSSAGLSASEVLPHIPAVAERRIQDTTAAAFADADVVFLALPHGHSARLAAQLPDKTVVIDCAADHRLASKDAWDAYYGGTYSGHWPYGIPEMPGHREQLQGATRVAVPGCFPTGATLALGPALQAGIIEPAVSVTSITGVSGAGKKASVPMLGSEIIGSVRAYNTAGAHRHTPEIAQNLGEYCAEPVTVSFTPVLAPMTRGILSVASATLTDPASVTAQKAREVYAQAYSQEPFVHVLAPGVQPATANVVGSNMCHLQVEVDPGSCRLLVTTAIDNLTKGTAGAAIQCMNLALGFPETAGLPTAAVAP